MLLKEELFMAGRKLKVVVDFGHGGTDPGAVFGTLIEKHMTMTTGRVTVKELERHGIEVMTTRNSDTYVGINDRAAKANAFGADYFVSIHYNAGGGDGVEAIHGVYAGVSKDLAQQIVNSIKRLGQNARPREVFSRMNSYGTDYHGVIRMTKMPAVIVEGAFIDSKDREFVDTIGEQEAVGMAIAHGILNYLKIAIKPQPVKETVSIPEQPPVSDRKYGVVTATKLNVRAGVGVAHKVIDTLDKGRRIRILDTQMGWHKFMVNAADHGWVSANYVKDNKIANCTLLNVRAGAGVKNRVITQLKVGTPVRVMETKNGWHRIILNPAEYGWVSGKYIK